MPVVALGTPPNLDGTKPHYSKYKKWLLHHFFDHVCSYCLLQDHGAQVEHYLPTTFDEDRKHDPTNLLLGCDRCNGSGGKGDYHPGHAKRKRLPHDRSGYEIVDIRRDDFAALFAISRNGNIAARPGPTRARTNWNIATLKLDLKKCDERREEVLLLRDRCETACIAVREGSTDKDRQTFKCLLEMMIPELARRYLLLTVYGLPVSNELAQRLARATEELRR